MTEVTATEAARNFSDILDAVEHRGEQFSIVRRGRVVARLDPARAGNGRQAKALLRRRATDPGFARDISAVRQLLQIESRG